VARFARRQADEARLSRDDTLAEKHKALFVSVQFAAVALLDVYEREERALGGRRNGEFVTKVLSEPDGREALRIAFNIDAKELFKHQPSLQEFARSMLWQGKRHDLDRRVVLNAANLLYIVGSVLVQLPLFVLIALYPPICRRLESSRQRWLVRTPFVTFWLTWLCDVLLAIGVTVLPTPSLTFRANHRPVDVVIILIIWLSSNVIWEFKQMMLESDVSSSIDPFNWIDLPSLLVTLAGLAVNIISFDIVEKPSAEVEEVEVSEMQMIAAALLAMGTLLLWLRTLRVTLISLEWGAYVLMVFKMLVSDVLKFLIFQLVFTFAFAAAAQKIFEPPPSDRPPGWTEMLPFHLFPEWAAESEHYPSCDVQFSSWPRAFVLLWEGGFTGEAYFDCVGVSTRPIQGTLLMYCYHILTSLLLLNMLIAMMSHSFDEVLEEARATYYFRLAQTSRTYDALPLPPLYFLRLPWEIVVQQNWLRWIGLGLSHELRVWLECKTVDDTIGHGRNRSVTTAPGRWLTVEQRAELKENDEQRAKDDEQRAKDEQRAEDISKAIKEKQGIVTLTELYKRLLEELPNRLEKKTSTSSALEKKTSTSSATKVSGFI